MRREYGWLDEILGDASYKMYARKMIAAMLNNERHDCALILEIEAKRLMDEGDEYDPLIADNLRARAAEIRGLCDD